MSDETPRFALPYILPGQAQKELFHNEALARIDAALQACVVAAGIDDPPGAPAEGECWIVGPAPSAGWTGRAHQLAMWTGGGWRFVAPRPGTVAWDISQDMALRWTGSAWTGDLAAARLAIGGVQVVGERQPAVPSPSGGTVIDVEARAAIDALTAALMQHGLIE